jgi:hypothetical protein
MITTFLDKGEVYHLGVKHDDGMITLVHLERHDDKLILTLDYAQGHLPEINSSPRELVWGAAADE